MPVSGAGTIRSIAAASVLHFASRCRAYTGGQTSYTTVSRDAVHFSRSALRKQGRTVSVRTCDDGVAAQCELAQRLPVRQRVLREAVHEHHHRLGRAIRQHQVNSKPAFWPRDGNLAPRRRPAELALLLRGASKCGRRCWSDVRVGRAGKGERPQNSSSASLVVSNRTSKSGHRKRPLRRRSPLARGITRAAGGGRVASIAPVSHHSAVVVTTPNSSSTRPNSGNTRVLARGNVARAIYSTRQ